MRFNLSGPLAVSLASMAAPSLAWAQAPVTLTFSSPQTAGISGFRSMWDQPLVLDTSGPTEVLDYSPFGKAPAAYWFPSDKQRQNADGTLKPGALVFDAEHRSLLVRFPGAAAQIAARLAQGYRVTDAEIVLPFRDTEMWPEGYLQPSGLSFMGDLWAKTPPQWHAVAWALRKPWMADATLGPTYNAYLNGAGFWAKYGAQDTTQDRFPDQLGPAEVSSKRPEGHLDVTASLTDAAYGGSWEARLRRFENCGFLVRKWETYDVRYHQGGYEWGVATAGRGILIETPKLVVTLSPGGPKVALPAAELAQDLPALAGRLAKKHQGGSSTAIIPNAEQIKVLAKQYGFARPNWMADWQWQRVSELKSLGGFTSMPDTPEGYAKWMDAMLAIMPRRWDAFDAADKIQAYHLYSTAWPAPVRQFWQEYWTAWLMPWRDTKDFSHIQWYVADAHKEENIFKYYARTGDWRGNVSYYRYSYTHNMSTMNFNHTAALGALLGGAIIGSERAMEDGRHGLEAWPLRTWSWYDGSTQESLDHYYFSLSLKDQKMFADYGPTELDRMIGRTILAKSVEELTSSYHPGLRHFIATSGRTGLAYVFAQQDGTKHIVHTLSHHGALTDLDNKDIYGGMDAIGHEALPGMIAQETLNSPWAPDWTAYMVDEKPLPYQMTNSFKMWGGFAATPLWKRNYMGRNYGMASIDADVDVAGTVPAMAQWRRAAKTVDTSDQLGTLLIRPGVNHTNLLDSLYHGTNQPNANGAVGRFGGMATLQSKNKMIVFTSPWQKADYPTYPAPITEFKSLQTSIGLFDFEKSPSWELFVDGARVTQFPVKVKAGQHITVHDGVSYLAITPLPSTDLGRTDEIVITDQTGSMIAMQGGGQAKPTLLIEQYNLQRDTPLPVDADWNKIDQAYGGYAIELGDEAEYPDFRAFQRHIEGAKLEASWDAAKKELDVSYHSGDDTLEAGYLPEYSSGGTDKLFSYRRVNGAWPYNAPGIDRDSTLTIQGTTGKLEKRGAVLTTEAGRMAYLQTEPITGTYAGFNPFPDLTAWSLGVPGGITVTANGRLGLARVTVRPGENKVWVDYAFRDDQKQISDRASALTLKGFQRPPLVEVNGKTIKVKSAIGAGQPSYTIPLGAD